MRSKQVMFRSKHSLQNHNSSGPDLDEQERRFLKILTRTKTDRLNLN